MWVTRKEVPVTQLRKMMLEELQRRNYSQTTARSYLRSSAISPSTSIVRPTNSDRTRSGIPGVPDRGGKLDARTVGYQTAALRFFFCRL